MVDFGEELIIESFRIPWLIWIQLLVFLLLIFLVYSFSLFTSDSGIHCIDNPSCSLNSSAVHTQKQPPVLTLQKEGENHCSRGGIAGTGNSGRVRRIVKKGEGSSSSGLCERVEDGHGGSMYNHHPCNIVRLAKIAFLKCLGLDSSSSSSHTSSNIVEREHFNER